MQHHNATAYNAASYNAVQIQCSSDTMQFREMALGGSQEVPGQSVATPVVPSGAIAQHLFCILYFVFMSNSEKNMYTNWLIFTMKKE